MLFTFIMWAISMVVFLFLPKRPGRGWFLCVSLVFLAMGTLINHYEVEYEEAKKVPVVDMYWHDDSVADTVPVNDREMLSEGSEETNERVVSAPAHSDEYYEGRRAGYNDGEADASSHCGYLTRYSARNGYSGQKKRDYEDGYSAGYEAGYADAQEMDNSDVEEEPAPEPPKKEEWHYPGKVNH